ncbi:hypothetical protein GCM10020229_55200 [Kitasatospora albolonga]|uniref:hypothetical protein n=1 Tax=Kitasatospora albolonga TaxID=68173 RepID=UPI0031EA92FD
MALSRVRARLLGLVDVVGLDGKTLFNALKHNVAVIGSEECADWSEQLLPWEQVEAKLPDYLVEAGLSTPGEARPSTAAALVAQLRGRLSASAAAADGECPDNDELFVDPDTGAPKLMGPARRRSRAAPRRCWGRPSRSGCPSAPCWGSWPAPRTGSSGGTGSDRRPAMTRN